MTTLQLRHTTTVDGTCATTSTRVSITGDSDTAQRVRFGIPYPNGTRLTCVQEHPAVSGDTAEDPEPAPMHELHVISSQGIPADSVSTHIHMIDSVATITLTLQPGQQRVFTVDTATTVNVVDGDCTWRQPVTLMPASGHTCSHCHNTEATTIVIPAVELSITWNTNCRRIRCNGSYNTKTRTAVYTYSPHMSGHHHRSTTSSRIRVETRSHTNVIDINPADFVATWTTTGATSSPSDVDAVAVIVGVNAADTDAAAELVAAISNYLPSNVLYWAATSREVITGFSHSEPITATSLAGITADIDYTPALLAAGGLFTGKHVRTIIIRSVNADAPSPAANTLDITVGRSALTRTTLGIPHRHYDQRSGDVTVIAETAVTTALPAHAPSREHPVTVGDNTPAEPLPVTVIGSGTPADHMPSPPNLRDYLNSDWPIPPYAAPPPYTPQPGQHIHHQAPHLPIRTTCTLVEGP